MTDNNIENNAVFSQNDPLDINELASLNDDISAEFIEQLQNQVSKTASQLNNAVPEKSADGQLFEEIPEPQQSPADSVVSTAEKEAPQELEKQEKEAPEKANINFEDNIDDNFIKKYKAKLNKQQSVASQDSNETSSNTSEKDKNSNDSTSKSRINAPEFDQNSSKNIEELTGGNIVEKPISKEQVKYNDSLDFLDNNIKYTKYVIYIDPENTDFIESLTVKERKNLINKILREQDDVALTKRRMLMTQTIIKHSIIAIITIALAVPAIYFTINASLEASINNYRRSKTIFQTLYKEKGKIKKQNLHH